MKAIVQHRYGSPDDLQLQEVDLPAVGPDQVLVQVRAASLHPDVWHVVCGRPSVLRIMGGGLLRPKFPIPGSDMAGVVHTAGSGVTRFRPGDPVFGETTPKHQWTHGGAFAEYVAVRERFLARKPDNVTFEQAASVPSSGFIALNNLRDRSRLQPGKTVLINGAGGGVGTIALQVIKAMGAEVTAVDVAGKLDMLRSLGADRVIDYARDDFTRMGVRYDLIFDVPGDRRFSDFRAALKEDGRYIPIGHDRYGAAGRDVLGLLPHFFKLMFLSPFVEHLRSTGAKPPDRAEVMATLQDLLETGRLTPMIDSTYPLEQVREAFRRMTTGELRGKVVLAMTGSPAQPG